jgi:hypothetical protein
MSLLPAAPVPLHLPALVELSSGIDAVYLSGRADPSAELLQRLELAKQAAQELDEPVEFELGDVLFQLSPFGWGKYTYSLEHAWGRLGIRKKGRLPELRVQARAEALHGASPASVVEFFEWLAADGIGEVEWSVNRIDLYGDFQGWALTPEIGRRFVARPKQLVTYMDGDVCTGFQFGNRKSKGFFGRLYDKTADMARNNSDWMKDSWSDDYNPALPVYRMEFEIKREAIRQFQVSTPADVLAAVADMWRYCTHDWLRLCVPTDDGTRSRWPLDPSWEVVQHASLRQAELGLARVRAKKGAASLARVIPQLVGYLVAFAALVGTRTLKETLASLPLHVAAYEQRTELSFAARVTKRLKDMSFR